MNMTESQVFEALGFGPESDGGNTPEAAVPANQEPSGGVYSDDAPSGESGKEQNIARSAPDGNETAAAAEGDGNRDKENWTPAPGGAGGRQHEGKPAEGEDQRLTPEQRRENAARRRRAETQAAISRALEEEREKHRAELDAFFRAAGLKNTITGAPITSMDEFKVWKQAYDTAKLQKDLKDGKLTPEGLEQAISDSPSMQKMKQLLERDEAARREAGEAAARAKIEAELQEIHKLDPSVSTAEDLLNMPEAREFYEYVRKGNSFLDAFYLASRERLTAAAAEAAKQQAMNAVRSKDHLHPAGTSRGAGASSVPAEEMELFKLLNPEATDSEIQAYYNRSQSK